MTATGNGGIPGQEDTAAQNLVTTTTDDNSHGNTSTKVEVVNPDLVRSWAEPILKAAVGTVPLPGTAEWAALADDDVRKRAAVVCAAVWWCEQHSPEALKERADNEALLHLLDEKRFAELFSSSRENWKILSWQQLQERRTTYTDRPSADPAAVARWVRTGSSETPSDVLGHSRSHRGAA